MQKYPYVTYAYDNKPVPIFSTSTSPFIDFVEYNSGEVLTIPDQSYSIQELLQRYTSGTLPALSANDDYDFDESEEIKDESFDQMSVLNRPSFDITEVTQELEGINNKRRHRHHDSRKSDDSKIEQNVKEKDKSDDDGITFTAPILLDK